MGAAEDVAIGDMNGDGYPDVVVACELAHLIYFENPGAAGRAERGERVIPASTLDRGSYIRVFLADFNDDGAASRWVAANKGGQNPGRGTTEKHRCRGSRFPTSRSTATPGSSTSWPAGRRAHQLATVRPRRRRRPRRHRRLAHGAAHLLVREREQRGGSRSAGTASRSRPRAVVTGVQHGGSRTSAATGASTSRYATSATASPGSSSRPDPGGAWRLHPIGGLAPDRLVGFVLTDINGDGRLDAFSGAYSQDPRDADAADLSPSHRAGRLAWFEQPEDPAGTWTRHDVSRRIAACSTSSSSATWTATADIDLIGTPRQRHPYDGGVLAGTGAQPRAAAGLRPSAREGESPASAAGAVPLTDGAAPAHCGSPPRSTPPGAELLGRIVNRPKKSLVVR